MFYFYLKHLYQKSLNWQINRWSILGAKKFQYSIIAVSLVLMLLFIVFIMASIYLFIEGKNDFIYSLAPNAAIKAQLEKLKQKYSPEKRLDQEKIAIGDLISNMLNAYNSIGVAYPQTINNVYKDVLITQSIGGGKKLYQHVKEDDFSYQVLNGGHDFTLCVELTTGRKCWGYDKRAYSSMYRDKWDWNNPTYRKCVNNEDCVAVRCCDYRGLAVNRNYESLYNKNCTPSECINAEILRGSICENNICALKTLETLDKPDTKDKNDYFSEIKTTGEVQNDRDSDSDFLSDEMEQRFATNKNNTDTDNDGHPDGEEVRNGYNPNGPGTIEDSLDRDKKRLADIKQIQLGLELYFNDEGKYPGELKFGGSLKSSKNMIMSAVPKNQTVAGSFCKNYYPEFIYLQRNNGESYFLTYCLETPDGVINAGSHTATPGKVFD
ncbi:MAG: thrombospondin type 3 repeat-containing protein [bacterium]|nr:thrombospondin type 3 repeat-containing protein [bacterium]